MEDHLDPNDLQSQLKVLRQSIAAKKHEIAAYDVPKDMRPDLLLPEKDIIPNRHSSKFLKPSQTLPFHIVKWQMATHRGEKPPEMRLSGIEHVERKVRGKYLLFVIIVDRFDLRFTIYNFH